MKIYSYTGQNSDQKSLKLSNKKSWRFKFPKFKTGKLLTWLFRVTAIGVFVFALLFLYYMKDLPDPNKLITREVPESTKIFARDGTLIYEIHGEIKRTQIDLDQISPFVVHSTIAIEDKDFYKHSGISIRGIFRAILTDIIHLKKSQGGSTITQQFVKNAILTKDKAWSRKLKEIMLSIAIETRFTKDQILKLYLNEIPYGRNAYGIEAAAQTYFGKHAKDLNLAESAYLAALPQATTYYNPFGPNRQALDTRKNLVLQAMREQGYINEAQEKEAKEAKVEFLKTKTAITAPHFVLMVQDYLAKKYGDKALQEGGLKVYTTLDLNLQKIAEEEVKTGAEKNSKTYKAYNAGLVATDPKTGQILVLVGSKDYFGELEPKDCTPGKNCLFEPNVNVAIAQRQPGSSFKPYVYVTAFKEEFKYSPASMLMDVITNFGKFGDKDYIPSNYNGKEHGPLSMRQALAGSLNIPAVKTLALVGVGNAVQTARDFGITSPMADCGLSLVLGGCEVKLIDHVSAMSVLANGGIKNDKTFILKIEGKNGNILEEFEPDPKEIIDPQAVYEVVNIMSDNKARAFVFGENSSLILPDRPVAAKTGTTQKWHDGWTVGFTPSLAAGVWVGNNDGTFLKQNADGVLVAAPIWNGFMKKALAGTPAEEFQKPQGIQKIIVDEISGRLPTQYTPATKTEIFADYSLPTEYDNIHIAVAYDSQTNLPATQFTPSDKIIYRNFTEFHSERPGDPNWENPVITWATANGYEYSQGGSTYLPSSEGNSLNINIVEPMNGATIETIPFKIIVSAFGTNPVARVDLFVDGQLNKSLFSAPFVFEINKHLPQGKYVLTAKAVDLKGNTNEINISVTVNLNQGLQMTDPAGDSIVIFPLNLSAESVVPFEEVNFYYQTEKGQPKLIGKAKNVSNVGEKTQYTLDWSIGPETKGTYLVFAKSSTGAISQKIKITIP